MTQAARGSFRQFVAQHPWGLWWTQMVRLTRIELRRNLFSWNAGWIYFLAFVPTFILLIHLVFSHHRDFAIGDADAGDYDRGQSGATMPLPV